MNETLGVVFDIQKFSLNDGPGIRTVVFMKGCPLRCQWCHNPESLEVPKELQYVNNQCVGCGKCAEVCPENAHYFTKSEHYVEHEKCIACGKCVEVCCYDALRMLGRKMTVDEVVAEVEKDKPYYGNDGGVTLSGGEPTMQWQFTLALVKKLRQRGINTAMETCGYCSDDKIQQLAEYVDLFLYDYKIHNSAAHKRYTGVENKSIQRNLEILSELNVPVILRCPIIKGVNDDEEQFKAIALINGNYHNIIQVELMPYHSLGVNKSMQIGYEAGKKQFPSILEEEKKQWLNRLLEYGCEASLG